MDRFSHLHQVGLHHSRIKQYNIIKKGKMKNDEQFVAIEGVWSLSKAWVANAPFETLFVCPELIFSEESKQLIQSLLKSKVECLVVSQKVMERMVERDKPDGLAALVKLYHPALDELVPSEKVRVIILDGLEIPGNVGTIIRTADATNTYAVILTNPRTYLAHPKTIHGSMGSIFAVKTLVEDIDAILEWLHTYEFTIFTATTRGSKNYRNVSYTARTAIIMGSERFGIANQWHQNEDQGVAIPMLGVSDSLNVGHAAALLLYEALYSQDPTKFR